MRSRKRPDPESGLRASEPDKITVRRLPLTGDFVINNPADVQKFIDMNADFVAAIVTYDDPSERSTQYAPYRLTVNGVVQPGGGM